MATDNFCQLDQVALTKISPSKQKLSLFLIFVMFQTIAEHFARCRNTYSNENRIDVPDKSITSPSARVCAPAPIDAPFTSG